jgi:hypothetical protein
LQRIAAEARGTTMPALFARSSNHAYRLALVVIVVGLGAAVAAPMVLIRTRHASARGEPIEQPIEFDHRHHARDDGIDCLYCHPGAETDAIAGIPATEVCMGCHGQIRTDSPLLAPVRDSWSSDRPIAWRRVHDLPDHVYFHHGVHVQAGLACSACHGDVGAMPRVARAHDLTMGWCLDCHRERQGGRQITALTTCSACHR